MTSHNYEKIRFAIDAKIAALKEMKVQELLHTSDLFFHLLGPIDVVALKKHQGQLKSAANTFQKESDFFLVAMLELIPEEGEENLEAEEERLMDYLNVQSEWVDTQLEEINIRVAKVEKYII